MREYRNGDRLIEAWDDANRIFYRYGFDGSLIEERPYMPEEVAWAEALAAEQLEGATADRLREKARAALVSNQTFLALGSPTNAQVVAQVKALTRQVNALIRLEIRDLQDDSGT